MLVAWSCSSYVISFPSGIELCVIGVLGISVEGYWDGGD